MPPHPAAQRSRVRRRTYVIDRPLQYGITARLLVPFVGVAALSTVALLLLAGRDAAAVRSASEVRTIVLAAWCVHVVVQAGVLVTASLVATHRVAGPARVIRSALDGMLHGDHARRLALREYDHLKGVADRLAAVRGRLQAQRAELDSTLEYLQSVLADGRVEEATRIVASLRLTEEVPAVSEPDEAELDAAALVREAGRTTAATAV